MASLKIYVLRNSTVYLLLGLLGLAIFVGVQLLAPELLSSSAYLLLAFVSILCLLLGFASLRRRSRREFTPHMTSEYCDIQQAQLRRDIASIRAKCKRDQFNADALVELQRKQVELEELKRAA